MEDRQNSPDSPRFFLGVLPGDDEVEGNISLDFLQKILDRVARYANGKRIIISKILVTNHVKIGDVVRIKLENDPCEEVNDIDEYLVCFRNEEGVLSVDMLYNVNES